MEYQSRYNVLYGAIIASAILTGILEVAGLYAWGFATGAACMLLSVAYAVGASRGDE